MKHAFQTLIGATVIASILGAAAPASANITKEDAKCHATIAKTITKYQAGLLKNLTGCHKLNSAGKGNFAKNCNLFSDADLKGGLSAARTKAKGAITKVCTSPLNNAVLALYPRCPSPVKTADQPGGAGDTTDGIDNFGELSDCLTALSQAYVDRVGEQAMGRPTVALSKEAGKCQGAIGKAVAKAMGTAGGSRTKCQAGVEKALPASFDYGSGCNAGDPDGKIGPAIQAVNDAIANSCGILSVAQLLPIGLCGQTTAVLQKCITDRVVKPVGNGLAAATLELPGTCASSADVVINAAFGQKLSNTRLDSGWTGFAHDVDVVDQSLGGVKLSGCDADCENCSITLDATNGYCRCENDPTVKCSTIEGTGGTCGATSKCVGGTNEGAVCVTGATCNSGVCGTNTCHCMFGPPLALSSAGVPACVVNRFASEFSGTTGQVGEYDVLTRTRALVHTGGNTKTHPCPICSGGACSFGPRQGKSCTVDATHPDFGPVSFDCPPDPGTNQSGVGLNLALHFTSGSVSITNAITGANCASGTCTCSECTGDPLVGCSSNADCTGIGTCGINLGGGNPKENGCTGGHGDCNVDGTCDSGPFDKFCSGNPTGSTLGVVTKAGKGVIPCGNNADCDSNSAICPGGVCGTCVTFGSRECFGTTIAATGKPGIFNSEGVSAFCSAATGSVPINQAGGLPGPGRVKLDFDFNVYCNNHTGKFVGTQFEEPGGSNCP